jgi:hypothetical protein
MPKPTFAITEPTWDVPDNHHHAAYHVGCAFEFRPVSPATFIVSPETCPREARKRGSPARPRVGLFYWPSLRLHHLDHSTTSSHAVAVRLLLLTGPPVLTSPFRRGSHPPFRVSSASPFTTSSQSRPTYSTHITTAVLPSTHGYKCLCPPPLTDSSLNSIGWISHRCLCRVSIPFRFFVGSSPSSGRFWRASLC